MPTHSRDEASVDVLELRTLEIEACEAFDLVSWKSLMKQLASTKAVDPAGVAAKLSVVLDGIQMDADQLQLDILRSAITDLQLLSRDR